MSGRLTPWTHTSCFRSLLPQGQSMWANQVSSPSPSTTDEELCCKSGFQRKIPISQSHNSGEQQWQAIDFRHLRHVFHRVCNSSSHRQYFTTLASVLEEFHFSAGASISCFAVQVVTVAPIKHRIVFLHESCFTETPTMNTVKSNFSDYK